MQRIETSNYVLHLSRFQGARDCNCNYTCNCTCLRRCFMHVSRRPSDSQQEQAHRENCERIVQRLGHTDLCHENLRVDVQPVSSGRETNEADFPRGTVEITLHRMWIEDDAPTVKKCAMLCDCCATSGPSSSANTDTRKRGMGFANHQGNYRCSWSGNSGHSWDSNACLIGYDLSNRS